MALTKRDWIAFFIGVALATILLAYAIQRTDTVQHHVCESNVKVRQPLEAYINTTIPLFRLSQKLQREEAALTVEQPPPDIQKLQAQLRGLQQTNFQHLLTLRDALHEAVVSGCPN